MARIDLKGLGHSYLPGPSKPEDYALRPMEQTWEDGKAYALLGPSGCGKTTLLNIISGLLTPSDGQVLFDGRDVTRLLPQERNIAQVFQFPVIYDTMSVYDNLAFPLRNRGIAEADVRTRVAEVAEMLELTDVLTRRAKGLGADAKQKISMGRGLVRSDVSAILFDEPLTVIDPHLKWLLRRKLKQVHERFALTMLYVTHDQVEAMTFADEVVVIYGGEVVQQGTPEALFRRPRHTFVGYFIGSPGMNLLPCGVDGRHAVIDGTYRIPLGEASLAKRPAGGLLELGVRPEFVELRPAVAGDRDLPVEVTAVEDLGNYLLVTAHLGQRILKVKLPEDASVSPGPAAVHFPPEHTLLYADSLLVE